MPNGTIRLRLLAFIVDDPGKAVQLLDVPRVSSPAGNAQAFRLLTTMRVKVTPDLFFMMLG